MTPENQIYYFQNLPFYWGCLEMQKNISLQIYCGCYSIPENFRAWSSTIECTPDFHLGCLRDPRNSKLFLHTNSTYPKIKISDYCCCYSTRKTVTWPQSTKLQSSTEILFLKKWILDRLFILVFTGPTCHKISFYFIFILYFYLYILSLTEPTCLPCHHNLKNDFIYFIFTYIFDLPTPLRLFYIF